MADVQKIVETVFTTVDRGATAGYNSIASVAQRIGRTVSSLPSLVTGAAGAFAGLASGPVGAMLELQSSAENTRITLAGMFATLGQARDFDSGLTMAAETMDLINVMAARLPGEAQDYVDVFRRNLPQIQGAIGGTVTEMARFSSDFTAVMTALEVAVPHAAGGLQRMLASSRASVVDTTPAFRALLPFMEQATRHTSHHVTNARDFRALTQQTRGEIVRLTLQQEGLQRMMREAGNTWEAQTGTFKSSMQMIVRLATAPLFEGAKRALGFINSLLMDTETGRLRPFAQTVVDIGTFLSTVVVRGFQTVYGLVDRVRVRFQAFAESMVSAPWFNRLIGVVDGLLAAMGMAGGDGGIFAPLMDAIQAVYGMYMANAVGVLDGLVGGVQALIGVAVGLWGRIMDLVTLISSSVSPHLEQLSVAVGFVYEQLMTLFSSALSLVGNVLMWLYENVARYLLPSFNQWLDVMGRLLRHLGTFLAMIARFVGSAAATVGARTGDRTANGPSGPGFVEGLMADFRAHMARAQQERERVTATRERQREQHAPPAARGGTHTHNDFRNSRFDITQRFAEGYDPDRIAVLFANDLGRVGEQRLQSGLEPAFGVR